MIFGCIDIGSNTTRLLVAEVAEGGLRELTAERVFTCIRKSLDGDRRIPPEKVEETVAVVAAQARTARELGASEVVIVGTAAIRAATNGAEVARGVKTAVGVPLRVLSGQEEARLSFVGAMRALPQPIGGTLAVVDVGGGSSEIAVGSPDGVVDWSESLPIGSGLLADTHLRSDPPARTEVAAVRRHVAAAFADLEVPATESAVAVGGTATSLGRVLGAPLDHESLERGVQLLCEEPIQELATRLSLDPERVRLLPAGMLVLQAVSDRFGLPLTIARGGLREGIVLELAGLSPAPPGPEARAGGGAP